MSKVYQVITDRMIQLLETGTVPWQRPWKGYINAPRNLVSDKQYRGINIFMLASTGYANPYWLTFKQIKSREGHVKKGEKGWPCVFWNWVEKENSDTGQMEKQGFIKYYTVFNVEQTKGINFPTPEVFDNFKPIQACEDIVAQMPDAPQITRCGSKACYVPSQDRIEIPRKELFEKIEEYYSTLFHELSHSTGHAKRLNRPGIMENTRFGTEKYSKEELVAEMGATFLCGYTAIENQTIDNSAAYINSWLSQLKKDMKLVVQAASLAQKSTDFILGQKLEDVVRG
tara:strand:- start:3706 stop:4560 length:855 start_codon:yes stop_codon:yes gene_type:complete